jgi:hypothetical protein
MRKYTRYTKEMLEPLVQSSVSVTEVMRKLGMTNLIGGVHTNLTRRIRHFGIDTAHFLGRAANRGAKHVGGWDKLSWQKVLVPNRLDVREKTPLLRRAMIESGIEHRCACGQPATWHGKPLCLQIEHKNGNPLDNRRANLCFLCPNCHTQTATFGSKRR